MNQYQTEEDAMPIHTPELQVVRQSPRRAAPGLRWGRGELKWTVLGMGGDPGCTEVTSHWGSGDIGANPGPATDSPCDLGQLARSLAQVSVISDRTA